MFVDASALVAILLEEPGFEDLAERLQGAQAPATSAIAIYETVLAVVRMTGVTVPMAAAKVETFLAATGIRIAKIGEAEAYAALDAHARFGKGRHPARLNLGDCFAYACARSRGAPLLYKGDDFARTDIAPA